MDVEDIASMRNLTAIMRNYCAEPRQAGKWEIESSASKRDNSVIDVVETPLMLAVTVDS